MENLEKVLDEKFIVGCLKNAIQILEVKKEGKKKINVKDYLKGNTLNVVKILELKMFNYLIKIEYDGTNFVGWQNQKNGRSIQQVIESVLKRVLKTKSK